MFNPNSFSDPILCIGAGSIGIQHLKNILHLGYDNISVVTNFSNNVNGCRHFNKINTALAFQDYKYAIICNPTAMHLNTLRTVLEAGIKNIYLEKPVSHNLKNVEEIKRLIMCKQSKVVVGYDLRFEPAIIKAKECIEKKKIGEVVSMNAVAGSYLPDWRPLMDYRKSMSASKAMGGGVLLDLIHEFDYAFYLMGKAKTVACIAEKSGILDIQTEDIANVILEFYSNAVGSIHLDYLQPEMSRSCTIIGTNGMIQIDFVSKEFRMIDYENNKYHFSYRDYSRNDRLKDAMKAFLDGNNHSQSTSFDEGCNSLEMVVAAKASCSKKKFISLKNYKECLF